MQVGSPTALAEEAVRKKLLQEARDSHGLYVAAGALWGAQDIQKMADRETLKVGHFGVGTGSFSENFVALNHPPLLPPPPFPLPFSPGTASDHEETSFSIQSLWIPG